MIFCKLTIEFIMTLLIHYNIITINIIIIAIIIIIILMLLLATIYSQIENVSFYLIQAYCSNSRPTQDYLATLSDPHSDERFR